MDRLRDTAEFVGKVVRDRYPTLHPPFHARWRHFVFDGRDLWSAIAAQRSWENSAAAARAAFDLAITSVLLDAGAGAEWRYHDSTTGLTAARSEGLALASLRWFEWGGLSDDPRDPLRADAAALCRLDARAVDDAFQSGDGNLLQGASGRAALLNRLGSAMQSRPDLFALADLPRPGGLFDVLSARASPQGRLAAATILEVLLEGLGSIWPNRPVLDGVPLGDCWPYPALRGERPADGFVPLHKLSQWLAYSLIEPLENAGLTVVDVGALTGLAEYRNGGLFVDMGVLVPCDAAAFSRTYNVSDPFVVGWRSATVALLDEIVPLVAAQLGLAAEEFPLPRVLEGGTWAAGRLIAREKRAAAGPPFQISSDGTVF
ncbi:MAG: uracil phosphoribosyltransferase [Gammaproteobacteria bacterium]|nr:uracil phosphoribosyltransferase [Gammaproteobacteria bacterium]